MNEEEKFNDLLRSKLSERDFPFDELNWDEAERLIIQQESRRKITRFALIFGGGLAAGILLMLPFIINTHTTSQNSLATKPPDQNPVAKNNVPPPVNTTQVTTTTDKKDKAPLPVQSAFVKKKKRTGIRGNSSINNAPPVAKTSNSHKPVLVATVNKPHQKNRVKPTSPILITKTSEHHKRIIPAETVIPTVVDTHHEIAAASTTKEKNTTIPKKDIAANSGNTSVENSSQNTIPATDNKNISPTTPTTNIPTPVNSTKTDKSIAAATTSTGSNSNNSLGINHRVAAKDSNAKSPLMIPGTTPYIPRNTDYSKNILSVYAGGNYSFGWNNNGSRQGNGLTPMGGFDFTHYFTEDISASLGIGYSELTGLNKTYIGGLLQYDFGATSSITSVTPQDVYYLAFPFKLQYSFDSKDMLSLGLNYLLLMTTSSTLSTYKQTYFTQTAGTTEKQNGYTQGFSNSDMQLSLSYTRMITGRFGISIEYYRDLDNIENNSIPGINQYAKNNGIRFILSYQLMK